MKQRFVAIIACVCAIGCAHPGPPSVSLVGPVPGPATGQSTQGILMVYSAWQKTGTLDPEHQVHSNYEVMDPAGNPVMRVRNSVSPMIEDPATVRLAPGRYIVKARVQGYGLISVPVLIESRRLTTVCLDDTATPIQAGEVPGEKVFLPDGRMIGWAGAAGK